MREAVIPPPMSAYEIHLESQVGLNFDFFCFSYVSLFIYVFKDAEYLYYESSIAFFLDWLLNVLWHSLLSLC